jgi:hypothetical protein
MFLAGAGAQAVPPSVVREALQAMLDEEVVAAFKSAPIAKGQTVAVLPLAGDSDTLIQQRLKSALAVAGLKVVEGKSDPMWDEVLKEVEWDQRKADMLDAATLVTFGKLKATQVLLYGFVRNAGATERAVFVEIELHASSIETKEHLWGQVFARRFYVGEGVNGIVRLDDAARRALTESLRKGEASLQSAAARITGIKTTVITPVAGDIDGYVGGRVRDLLAASSLTPRDLNVRSLGEAELLLRAQPDRADGIVYGALRDLSRERKNVHYFQGGYFKVIDRQVYAEVQLALRAAKTSDVLWSATVNASIPDPEQVTWSDLIAKHPTEALKVGACVLAAVVVLVLVGKFFGAMRRPR